ncbi:TIGR04104 family putative zinc finger protein [Clostridium sp. B9]|uniref:TIGR04104 family putative zinc finger protein n=1 Tax=Clostridium sp. B9 TaxID=3423224 RepID=UPI003D2F1AFE
MKCKKCGNKISHNDILRATFWNWKTISCKECGEKYKISLLSKIAFALLIILPVPFVFGGNLNIQFIEFIALMIFYYVILFLLNPFIIKLNKL